MTFLETAVRPTARGAGNVHQVRKASKNWNSVTALQVCRDREIIRKMADVADVLVGMLALRREEAEKFGEAGRLAFAREDSNVKLAGAAMDALNKVAEFGYAKLSRIDYVGDAPAIVQNKLKITLKIAGEHAPQGNGNDAVVVDNGAQPADLSDGNGSHGRDDNSSGSG